MALGAAQSARGTAPFNDSIRVADLKADLFFLAGDGFKGRLVGTPENALAAEFVRSRFAAPDRVLWALWGAGWGIVYVVYFTLMGW